MRIKSNMLYMLYKFVEIIIDNIVLKSKTDPTSLKSFFHLAFYFKTFLKEFRHESSKVVNNQLFPKH